MKGITFLVASIFSVAPCFQLFPMIKKQVVCKGRLKCNGKLAKVQKKFEQIKWLLMQMKTDGKQLSKKDVADLESDIGIILMQVISFDKRPKKPYN